MQPTVTATTGGIIKLNIIPIINQTLNTLRNILSTNGLRRKLLSILAVISIITYIKYSFKHKERENREREKARIWKEEMKDK